MNSSTKNLSGIGFALAAIAGGFSNVAAAPQVEESARLLAQIEPRIKAIYESDQFAVNTFAATWLPDGSGYLKLERPAGAVGEQIASYDSSSGKRTVVVASADLLDPATSQRLGIREFVRSPSGKRFLLRAETGNGTRTSGYWLFETESGALHPLMPALECASIRPRFRPMANGCWDRAVRT